MRERVWTVRHLAAHLGVSKGRLRSWRIEGIGPEHHEDGGRVLYTEEAVAAWIRQHPDGRPD